MSVVPGIPGESPIASVLSNRPIASEMIINLKMSLALALTENCLLATVC